MSSTALSTLDMNLARIAHEATTIRITFTQSLRGHDTSTVEAFPCTTIDDEHELYDLAAECGLGMLKLRRF